MTSITERTARLALGVALPATLILISYAPSFALAGNLPSRFATHFDGSGEPDGSMTPLGLAVMSGIGIAIGLAICSGVAVYRKPLPQFTGPGLAALGGFLAGLFAAIHATTVVSQRNLDDWSDASGPWWVIVFGVLLSFASAALAARLALRLPVRAAAPAQTEPPSMNLKPGERAVWNATSVSPLLGWMGGASLLLALAIAVYTSQWLTVAIVAVAAVAISATGRFRVRADRAGLRVRYGFLPWPQTQIATADIAQASAIDVRPMQWGGWGYRGSLTLMRQAAAVHRAGPGIRVDLHNGKVFVVTVDRPEDAVALLNGEVARTQPVG